MEIRIATETDFPALLEMVREFFAWEGNAFDVEQIDPALSLLLARPELGQSWLFQIERRRQEP